MKFEFEVGKVYLEEGPEGGTYAIFKILEVHAQPTADKNGSAAVKVMQYKGDYSIGKREVWHLYRLDTTKRLTQSPLSTLSMLVRFGKIFK